MQKIDPTVQAYLDSFKAGLQYCEPHWERYARLYEFFVNKRFDALDATYSKIMPALAYAAVMDRAPKIRENVFSGPDFVSLTPRDPEGEFTAESATAWLKHTLRNQIKIQHEIDATIQSVLFGGIGYRMPGVTYVQNGGKWQPVIYSRHIDFFHVIPAPGGGMLNPLDNQQTSAVPWVMVIDWWTEDKIRASAEKGLLNKEPVRRMLEKSPSERYDEENYRNRYAVVGNVSFEGPEAWRQLMRGTDDKAQRRRIVHWFRRDKHIIVGEDAFLLYEGEPVLPGGAIPLAKYITCPDMNNWFGLPYLGMLEDIIKAEIMNLNYRFDHLIGTMFPTTWVRKDLMDFNKATAQDFRPRPFDVKTFPMSGIDDIRKLVWHDRRAEINAQAFVEEDRLKAFLQKVAGQTETTSSMNDVVGNKTVTGVTSIMNELAARPNMESTIFEYCGLREECLLILALGRKHMTDGQYIRGEKTADGFPWRHVSPQDIAYEFDVETHGTRFLAEKNVSFQKLLALFPYWNQSPVWDNFELNRQVAEVADVLPNVKKAMVKPEAMAPMAPPAAEPAGLGGMASSMDIGQQTRSVANRTTPEPRTGRAITAGF